MNLKKNSILIGLALVFLASGCQWRNARHGELMPGIQSSRPANDRSSSKEEKNAIDENAARPENESQRERENASIATSTENNSTEDLFLPAPFTNRPEQILKRTGYVTSYNQTNKIPNWVAWNLTADDTRGRNKRAQIKFQEDIDVPAPRATDWDYSRSGFDRGHMCPAADNKWSADAMTESFLFTNICPQNHHLNIGDWNELEMRCRRWAEAYGAIQIVAGPILFNQRHQTIGKNKVVVPEAFFKVVLCMGKTPKAIGFIYRNTEGNRPQGDYVNSIDQIERITGIDFFAGLPDNIEKMVEAEANLDDWAQ